MKSLESFTIAMLHSCGIRCGVNPDRDTLRVHDRVKHEGDSFLTITLPSLGSAFDRALDQGRWQASDTPAFSWHRRGLPEFLRGFLLLVFDASGTLLEQPSVEAIACIRQICRMHAKIKRDCSPRRIRKAIHGYAQVEEDLSNLPRRLPFWECFKQVSSVIWTDLLREYPFGDPRDSVVPKHGPGAVREGLSSNTRWDIPSWTARLDRIFPATQFAYASESAVLYDPESGPEILSPARELPVKVTLVPKTQKTPRVIAIEPCCNQYIQQGLMKLLVPLIERNKFTAGRVNFSDQSVNQRLATLASIDGRFATIDLSEASDRVSSRVVHAMLASVPNFRDQVFACRTPRAELPDGNVVVLRKFASMGSALCFPMEAMVFYCIIVASRIYNARVSPTSRAVHKFGRDVFVYGDDILIPVGETLSVIQALESYGLKVNRNKSFWTGKFRESCGEEAFDGNRVTPIYLRNDVPRNRHDTAAIVSLVSMANQMYLAGHWYMCKFIRDTVERVVGKLPHVGRTAGDLGWVNYSNSSDHRRWNKNLMRFERRGLVPTPTYVPDPISGYGALTKCLVSMPTSRLEIDKSLPASRPEATHLARSVRRGRLALKARWVAA